MGKRMNHSSRVTSDVKNGFPLKIERNGSQASYRIALTLYAMPIDGEGVIAGRELFCGIERITGLGEVQYIAQLKLQQFIATRSVGFESRECVLSWEKRVKGGFSQRSQQGHSFDRPSH